MGERISQRLRLPTFYLEGFAAREPLDSGAIWIHRPAIGEWQQTPIEPSPDAHRHFNAVIDENPGPRDELEERILALRERVSPLLREVDRQRHAFGPSERCALAELLALAGMTTFPRAEALGEGEMRAGAANIEAALAEMGWVLLSARLPGYFVTSNSPLHISYPRPEESWTESRQLRSPGTEITVPLTSRVALFATWKRRSVLWREASEDVLMEINARTIQRGKLFVAAPWPALPG